VTAIRETQTEHGWHLRPADLNDFNGLHALAADPLVYRYLFDGSPPDKDPLRARLQKVLLTRDRQGSVCGFWKMIPRNTRVASS
jgi:hypothetical protein